MSDRPRRSALELVASIAAPAAAAVLLLGLIGGAVVYVRLFRAGLPADAGVAVIPKTALIELGLRKVVAPYLFAVALVFGTTLIVQRLRRRTEISLVRTIGGLQGSALSALILVTPWRLGNDLGIVLAVALTVLTAYVSIVTVRDDIPWHRHRGAVALGAAILLVFPLTAQLDRPAGFDRIGIDTPSTGRIAGPLIADTPQAFYIGQGTAIRVIQRSVDLSSVVITGPAVGRPVPSGLDRLRSLLGL